MLRELKPCPPEPDEAPPPLPNKERKHDPLPVSTVASATTVAPSTKSRSLPRANAESPRERPRMYERLIPVREPQTNATSIQSCPNLPSGGPADRVRPTNTVSPMRHRTDKEEVIVVPVYRGNGLPPTRSQSWNGKHSRPDPRKGGQHGPPNQTGSSQVNPSSNGKGGETERNETGSGHIVASTTKSSGDHEPFNHTGSGGIRSSQIPAGQEAVDPRIRDGHTNIPPTLERPEAPNSGTRNYPSADSDKGETMFPFPPGKTDSVFAVTCLKPGEHTPTQEAWMARLQNFTVETLHENLLKIGLKQEIVEPFREQLVDGEVFSSMTDKMLREASPDLKDFELMRLRMFRDNGKFPKTSQGATP